MCNYQTLYYNDTCGYVICCTVCSRLQLGFGCVLINFCREEFNSFRRVIAGIVEQYEGITLPVSKAITIPTPADQLFLYLSGKEIEMLHTMIEEADNNLAVQDLMNLF
jgi:hypothetical protein